MELERNDQIASMIDSIHLLYQDMDRHRQVIGSILAGQSGEQNMKNQTFLCSREHRLKKAIQEAVEVIDESRKSFKSKKLEGLRKNLIQVLVETG
ncbi:MAG: hypothetical protein AB7S75_21975 [Desulfococcaceae bacterium]